MAPSELKGALSLSYGGIGVQSPEPTPAPYFAGIPAAVADFKRNMTPLTITPSSVVLSAEGEALNLLGRFDLGARIGARLPNSTDTGSILGINATLFAQYRIDASNKFSVPVRLLIGAEHFSGEAFSLPEAKKQSLSGTVWKAGASVGIESIAFQEYPVSLSFEGYVAPSGADLGHGYNVLTGVRGMVVFSIGKLFSDRSSSSPENPSAPPPPAAVKAPPKSTDAEKCTAAANELTLAEGALNAAVSQCTGSALPVFEAMAAKLKAFKLDDTPAGHKVYADHLAQFGRGIDDALKAGKLTRPEAVAKMKELADFYKALLPKMFMVTINFNISLETALAAIQYPLIGLFREEPSNTVVKGIADKMLEDMLECAKAEGKSYLPNVLEKLIEIGAGSDWLKSHKQALLDATLNIADSKLRAKIIQSINSL